MAPFVALPDGAQVELVFIYDSQVVTNRLWFWTASGPPGSADLVGLADGVFAWYAATILPALSDQLQLVTVVATDWSVPDQVGEVSSAAPVDGGITAEGCPANVSVVVPFRWPLTYSRLKKNKNYVCGVPVQEATFNTPSATIRSVLFEGYAALIDAARTFSPGDYWYWVVTSAYEDGATRLEQLFGVCIGPKPAASYKLGQRRKRLPLS